jgi:hypothetical protein
MLGFEIIVRLLGVALLEYFGFVIALRWVSVVGSTGFFAILVFFDVLATPVPAEESVEEALELRMKVPRLT